MDKIQDTLIISVVGDLMVIGRKNPKQAVDVINALQGEEAINLYKQLITKKDIEVQQNTR